MRLVLLVLIPTIATAGDFTTSLGDTYPYMVSAITTDAAGNTYVVGSRAVSGIVNTVSANVNFLPLGILENLLSSGSDVFLTKLDPNGKVLFTDIFGGKGSDVGAAIALDPVGNIYIAGATTSDDFPLSNALQTQANPADGSGFIIKLSNDGRTIYYSTYFGGSLGLTFVSSLATDSKGNLYLTGLTTATDFLHTAGMPFGPIQQTDALSVGGAIVASISAAGDKIIYSGVIAGKDGLTACSVSGSGPGSPGNASCEIDTEGIAIAVDTAGNAYIAGDTGATDLPSTTGAFLTTGDGPFVTKVSPGGTTLSYLTYLTAPSISARTALSAIAIDGAGDAYLAGWTSDTKFPATPGSFQAVFPGASANNEAFLAKLKPDGSALVWATFLGGSGNNSARSIALDGSGNVWSTGFATQSDFPNAKGWSTGNEFLIEMNPVGSKLSYSALYPTGSIAQGIAIDPAGLIHVAGEAGFISAIVAATVPTTKIFGFENAANVFLTARIAPAEVISIFGPGIGPAAAVTASPVGGFYPKMLAGVEVTINGINMPLLYVSSSQINAVLPMGIAPGAGATVRVTNGTAISPDYPTRIIENDPEAFPLVLNQDGTINSQKNPAKSGSIVTFYATGWQSNFAPLVDGQIATTAEDGCQGSCYAYVDDSDAEVLYAGPAPGIVAGVTQFNVRLGAVQASDSARNLIVYGASTSVIEFVWVSP
jgi:uncharacterized protein (TIGR03437 family)